MEVTLYMSLYPHTEEVWDHGGQITCVHTVCMTPILSNSTLVLLLCVVRLVRMLLMT